jgi:hypothetical protein
MGEIVDEFRLKISFVGSKEIDSKGMNVPGLDFQCLTTRYNVVEANWLAG